MASEELTSQTEMKLKIFGVHYSWKV